MNRDQQNDFKMEGRSYLSFFLTENLSATTVAAIAKEFMTSLQTQPPNLSHFQTNTWPDDAKRAFSSEIKTENCTPVSEILQVAAAD